MVCKKISKKRSQFFIIWSWKINGYIRITIYNNNSDIDEFLKNIQVKYNDI